MKPLSTAENFGAVDADSDELLLSSFEDHEAFKDVLQFRRFLIAGKKGSGKTAIFKKMLTISEPDYFCFGHTFSDYPWHYHDKQARIGIPDFDKFTHSWKYLILLTISKIILNQDQSLPHDDVAMTNMLKLERFVIDSYGTRDPDVSQIFTPTKYLKLKPHFDVDLGILKAGVSPEGVPISELPVIIQEVNSNLLDYVLSCLNPGHRYFVCFDQLDLGFDLRNPDYSNRLIGLLLACKDINLRAKEQGKKLFVTIFLRSDIYDILHFEDKNKITENFLSLIEWDTTRSKKTLKELMQKRFSVVLGNSPSEVVKWEDVFNEEKEMSGRQTKYKHIADRTYLRPRDIIKFCNLLLDKYKQRVGGSLSGESSREKIDNVDVHNSRQEYSDYLYRELDDEIHKHVPNYEDYLEVLKRVGAWQFDKEQFDAVCKSLETTSTLNPVKILQELFEFSVIGFYRTGGRGGGSEYVFRYRESNARFDTNALRFRIHPGLIEKLDLKRGSSGDSFEEE